MATLNIKNLPDGLYQRLKQRARRQHRSVAQEVTQILSQTLAEPEPLSILELRGLGRDVWGGTEGARYVAEERRAWD
jgi:plasmid stability protein